MSPKPPKLQYRLEYAGYRLLGAAVRRLAGRNRLEAGRRAGFLAGPKSRRRHPRMLRNIAAAFPEKSEAERERLARDVWRNLGYVLGEFFHIDEIVRDRVEVENAELLRAIAVSGKGAVFCGAHQANWEGGSGVLAGFGLKPLAVYRSLSNPLVDADFKQRRLKYYPGGLTDKLDPETPVAMIRYARTGGSLALLVDQMMYHGPGDAVLRYSGQDHALSGAGVAPMQCSPRADHRPAPCRACASSCESSPSTRRAATTATPTSTRPPRACRRNWKNPSASTPNNGCGPTTAGTEAGSILRALGEIVPGAHLGAVPGTRDLMAEFLGQPHAFALDRRSPDGARDVAHARRFQSQQFDACDPTHLQEGVDRPVELFRRREQAARRLAGDELRDGPQRRRMGANQGDAVLLREDRPLGAGLRRGARA